MVDAFWFGSTQANQCTRYYQLILQKGIEHQGMINAQGFEEIVDDLLFQSPGSSTCKRLLDDC
jgi:hypothetical protein